jgi:hypothetical protein
MRRSEPNSRSPYSLYDRDQRAEPPMGGARLTVHVTIEPGESLSGSVLADPAGQAIAFSGWLGLVAAINLLRRQAGQVTAPPSSDEANDTEGPL